MKDKFSSVEAVRNTLWCYDLCGDRWTQIANRRAVPQPAEQQQILQKNSSRSQLVSFIRALVQQNADVVGPYVMDSVQRSYEDAVMHEYVSYTAEDIEGPCARFAHQFVYDSQSRVHYLFGGNPGEGRPAEERLDDFWLLRLEKPDLVDVLRRMVFCIRKACFAEMCIKSDISQCIQYLQQDVAQCVDLNRDDERQQFEGLSQLLFQTGSSMMEDEHMGECGLSAEDRVRTVRMDLFTELLQYFPEHMKEPVQSIEDMV
jgi:hypothetical protein